MNSLVPMGVAILILGFFWLAIRTARRQKAESERISGELGFTKVEQPPAEFVARIKSIENLSRGRAEIHNLFIRGCGRFDLYVFDLWTGNRSDHRERTAAIVSHDFNLPAFRLFPAIPFSGRIAGWLNKFIIHMAGRRGFVEYAPKASSRFTAKYRLYVTDPGMVDREVPESVWTRMADLEAVMTIQGDGDLIVFNSLNTSKPAPFRTTDPEEYRVFLQSLMECGGRLHGIFGEVRRLEAVH